MRVFGVVEAVGQGHAAPEIDKIEPGLKREQRVEKNQRAQHRLRAQKIIELGRFGGDSDGRFAFPNRLAADAAMDQWPDCAGDEEPE